MGLLDEIIELIKAHEYSYSDVRNDCDELVKYIDDILDSLEDEYAKWTHKGIYIDDNNEYTKEMILDRILSFISAWSEITSDLRDKCKNR